MKIIPHGAAREVTGTCHELQVAGKRILLDCGLFQGKRSEAAVKNATFTFDPAKDIDAMILSHAHMDHVGRIPVLWKRGYRNPIYCTYATKDLSAVMLQDGGFIQEKDEEFFKKHCKASMLPFDGPLYTQQDGEECGVLFQGRNYNEWFDVLPGVVRAKFIEAGHVLGSAMVLIEVTENGTKRRVGFSGDLGRENLPIIRDPEAMEPVEALICESTYGNRTHEDVTTAREKLKEIITRTAKRGGKILLPAFSLERTQQIVYELHFLWDKHELPPVPIFIDSPLASRITDVFMKHPECYDREMYDDFLSRAHNPFYFSLLKYTESVDESKSLNGKPGPMVLMAGSGMCEAGRIRHHLQNELEDDKNTFLAVGYMAENTLGAKIVDPTITEVKIFDRFYRKRAEVAYIEAYSGHADQEGLNAYVRAIDGLKKVILVHGEPEQMDPFGERIRSWNMDVAMPEREEVIEL
ncbi:MBL fold metallo-hydrolase [Candidatus Peregrinibacteria bacterium]|nr:MBL fold metallo-hydrolase [Candidatus Peregrinibacteria bacterium]